MPHSDCFGKLFPDPARQEPNRWLTGKIFALHITSIGIGEQGRETRIDQEQWDRCQACSDFAACRDLSFGTLLMHTAFR